MLFIYSRNVIYSSPLGGHLVAKLGLLDSGPSSSSFVLARRFLFVSRGLAFLLPTEELAAESLS